MSTFQNATFDGKREKKVVLFAQNGLSSVLKVHKSKIEFLCA